MGVCTVTKGQVLYSIPSILLAEKVGNGRIIIRSMLESFQSIHFSAALRDLSFLKLLEELRIVRGITQNCNTDVVLGRRADQSDPADVNFLHSLGNRDINLSNGVLERVQVADDVVNFVDVLFGEVFLVGGKVASKDAGMNLSKNQRFFIDLT